MTRARCLIKRVILMFCLSDGKALLEVPMFNS